MEPTDRPGPRNRATKWTARLGLAGLTILAAWASYLHALPVVQAADGHGQVSWFIPVLADLLIATATANILDASRNGERWPRLSMVAIGVGVVVTVGMNVASGSPHSMPPWLVNVWPPVAFVLALESFAGHVRRGRGGVFPDSVYRAPSATSSHPEPPEPLTTEAALAALVASTSQRSLAKTLGVPRSRVEAWAGQVAPVAESPAGEAQSPAAQDSPAEASVTPAPRPSAGVTDPAGVVSCAAAVRDAAAAPAGAPLNGDGRG